MADNKLQSLTEIFNEKIFRIPDFQRGYSWETNQLEDFWEDLENLKEDKIHYIGLLTVEPISKSSVQNIEKWKDDLWLLERSLGAYYLIDGQQRLTTSIILINEILDRLKGEEGIHFQEKSYWVNKFLFQAYGENYRSYIFGYERDNPSDEYFKTEILKQESSTADKVPKRTLYTFNLKTAKEFFQKKLEKLEKVEIEEIFKKVTTKFKFNFYEIDDELDVYVTFETMNNRGKPLSNLELLKNRLIYLSTLLDVDTNKRTKLRKDINETWKTIYEFLGKYKDNPMDDDDFLRNHWIMYFKYDRKESASYAKFLLNKKFTTKNVLNGKIELSNIIDYINSLSKSVKSWFYLFNPQFSEYEDETKEWIQKLNRLGMSAFPPLFMAAMTKCEEEEEFLPLFKSAERFIFLVFRMSQRPSNTKNSHFYRRANLFYFGKDNTTIQSTIEDIDWVIEGESGEGDDYHYRGWFDLLKFKDYVKDQYKKGEGFYSWNGLRYFLFEYELYLQGKANGNQKVTWSDFNKRKKEDTIEHIYPQTPKDDCWTSVFTHPKKQKRILLNSLGNLVLLGQSKNSEFQNKCFEFKKKHTNKEGNEVGFFNGTYSEIEISSYPLWTPFEIQNRSAKMFSFLEERWGIDFEEWEDVSKEDLMQLDFLHK